MTALPQPTGRFPALILLPFLVYVTLDYTFRVNNAMIVPALVAEFRLGPAELGFVTSAFFVTFAATQLPMGLALDRFGPRPVVAALLAVAVLGGVVYVTAGGVAGLALGRALIGIGMAASLMGGVKAGSLWFPPHRLPQITALHVALTGLGGMAATGPMAAVLALVDWRQVLIGLMAISLLVIVLVLLLVPSAPRPTGPAPGLGQQLGELRRILTSLRFWRYAPVAMTGIGASISYQTLWAPLWLRDVVGFSAVAQAWTLFAMFAAVAVGNLGFGWLFQRMGQQGRSVVPLVMAGFALSILLQAFLGLSGGTVMPASVWVLISALYACPIAIYTVAAHEFPPALSGRVASGVNALVFVTAFGTQWATGLIIEAFPVTADGGYAVRGHMAGLWTVIALQVAALAWYGLSGGLRRRFSEPR
ncbi:MAG: MFS transporter [Alphaproteobacteria bacterium]|jgi:predicted MFS family arabinose efflux permease|nr:MFS transporter [Alphaproteobacteria bacterium]